jgi:hypothetical protein
MIFIKSPLVNRASRMGEVGRTKGDEGCRKRFCNDISLIYTHLYHTNPPAPETRADLDVEACHSSGATGGVNESTVVLVTIVNS